MENKNNRTASSRVASICKRLVDDGRMDISVFKSRTIDGSNFSICTKYVLPTTSNGKRSLHMINRNAKKYVLLDICPLIISFSIKGQNIIKIQAPIKLLIIE
jgi:hypothetical protein